MTIQKPIDFNDVVCPFCGLACEDLSLEVRETNITANPSLPQYCRDKYKQASLTTLPSCRVNQNNTDLDVALQATTKLLGAARNPLFYGLAVDVNGARATMQLAERCRGIIDHINSMHNLHNTRVMQDEGWIMGTLSEVANRAEIIVIFGTYPLTRFPRLIERLVPKHGGLFRKEDPEFVLIGPWRDTAIPEALKPYHYRVINTEPNQFDACIRNLSATLLAKSPPDETKTSSLGAIPRLSKDLLKRNYSAFIWSAAEFDTDYPELALETLSRTIKHINRTVRCVAMPLGGSLGDTGFYHVSTWQSGYPCRVSFAKGYPEYDALRFNGQRLLNSEEADLLVWISPLDPTPPPKVKQTTIAIAHPAMPLTDDIDIFIPTGVPGVDHTGHIFRFDSIVSLPLQKIRNSTLQPAAKILTQLCDQVKELQLASNNIKT